MSETGIPDRLGAGAAGKQKGYQQDQQYRPMGGAGGIEKADEPGVSSHEFNSRGIDQWNNGMEKSERAAPKARDMPAGFPPPHPKGLELPAKADEMSLPERMIFVSYSPINPRRKAMVVACDRFDTPSLAKIFRRCFFTVCRTIFLRRPISRFDNPIPNSRRISISFAVRSFCARRCR